MGEPFPTLYWLTCPYLSKEVDHLEAAGSVKRLEHRLQNDPSLRAAMVAAHVDYRDKRQALLGDHERHKLLQSGRMAALSERGIGGIADWDTLKCLHLHVAHALAGKNPIGGIVLDELTRIECSDKEVICSAFV